MVQKTKECLKRLWSTIKKGKEMVKVDLYKGLSIKDAIIYKLDEDGIYQRYYL